MGTAPTAGTCSTAPAVWLRLPAAQTLIFLRPQPGPDFSVIFCSSFGLGSARKSIPDFGIIVISSYSTATALQLQHLQLAPRYGFCSTAPALQLLLYSRRSAAPDLQILLFSSYSTAHTLQPLLPQEPLQAHILQERSQAHSLCSSPRSPCKHTFSADPPGALASARPSVS